MDINKGKDWITINVRVIPRSSRSEVVGEVDGVLKIKLKAPPVEGAANEELVSVLAKHFNTSRSNVELVGGLQSKNKRVRISGIKDSN